MDAPMPAQRAALLPLHEFLSAVLWFPEADERRTGPGDAVKRLSPWVSMETRLRASRRSSVKEPGLWAPSSGSAHTDIAARHERRSGVTNTATSAAAGKCKRRWKCKQYRYILYIHTDLKFLFLYFVLHMLAKQKYRLCKVMYLTGWDPIAGRNRVVFTHHNIQSVISVSYSVIAGCCLES